ncbi:phage tail protein [Variovorax sp. UMC13]|uniref:phage tail protein n=1 Tax=Variovorax sp. UMC13 TaxID=1862326 RepID=UPI00160258E8|nr:phage tail protein [Variovorax sp. UMC13]
MPQVIAYGLAAIFTAGTVTAAITFAAYAITVVGMLALSSYQKNKAERAARAAFDAAQVDRLANVPATVASRELVLGRMRKGGTVFFRSSVGQYKEKFVMCLALAAHEIDAVERIYFNDQPIDLNSSGEVLTGPWGRTKTVLAGAPMTGTSVTLPHTPLPGSVVGQRVIGSGIDVLTEQLNPMVNGNVVTIASYDPTSNYSILYQHEEFTTAARVRWYLGAPGQSADPRLMSLLPGVWTPAHRVDGVAYLICEFDYDETAYPSGLPNVTALVRGAKIYDPRDGLTRWTESPAMMMRYVHLHPQFGKRNAVTAAEDARFMAAANACDTRISYTGSDWVPMFRAAMVVPFGAPTRDVFDDLSQAMGGQWAYAAGEIFVRAGVYQAPTISLNDADLAVVQRTEGGGSTQNPVTISTHRARNDKINTVLPRIWDEAAAYVETPITPFRADSLVAADGAELVQEVTMPAVFYAGQAFHIAGIMLRDGRDPLTVTAPFKLRAYPVQLFDCIEFTSSRYGWVNKEFQVLGRTFLPDGFVQLTLKENTAYIYQFGAPFVPQGLVSNSGLPRPWDISPPTITSVSSGEDELIVQGDGTIVNGVRVTWAPVFDVSIRESGSIEVQFRTMATGEVRTVTVPGDATEAVATGFEDGELITIVARSRNTLAISNWSLLVSHVVVGKTEPPPNVENLSISGGILSWSLPRRVPDLAGFVFRFHYGSNLDWNSATPLHEGIITESPWEPITRPGGPVSIMVKAIDTSGNVSLASGNIIMDLGDPPIANVVEEWDFGAMGWPFAEGEQSGWTLVGGNPSANALDSFYGTDDQSFYGADTEPFYDIEAYGQMVFVTADVPISSALAGSIMTLEAHTQGTDLRIEYRLAGPGTFFGGDNDSFYGPDAEPFYGPPGGWMPWPGQVVAANEAYQFRVTIGAGTTRSVLESLVLTVDAPDLEEHLADVPIAAGGTAVPYAKPFTSIKTVQATLQANASGAITVETVKTDPLAPVIRAFNAAHVSVSGATADITLKGY